MEHAPSNGPGTGLLDQLPGDPEVDGELSDLALVQALLDFEDALVRAQARVGLVGGDAAEVVSAVERECRAEAYDIAQLGRDARDAGNPVVSLVRALEFRVPEQARPYVHRGATSQDTMDTAFVLVARRSVRRVLARLDLVRIQLTDLATTHRATLLPARTLLQQALPTTFGLTAANWLAAVGDARAELARADGRLRLELGGAAGTLAALGEHGLTVLRALAGELQLPEPVLPWHTDRQRLVALGAAAATTTGVLGKVATDLALLSQTEIAEVREGATGGSSTLPHKQNSVGAVLGRAAALRAPGLLATLAACLPAEHQRAAGAWHAEWEPLRELLHLAGGAAASVHAALDGLVVHDDTMRANLDVTHGLLLAESVASALTPALGRQRAHDLVGAACRTAEARGATLREVLGEDGEVVRQVGGDRLDAALDPAGYLGSADAFVDRALSAYGTHPEDEHDC